MDKYKIVKMEHCDIEEILQIEEKCYGPHHWSYESFVIELSNKISSYRCVKDENNKCLGYLGIWKIVDEAHVTNLSVHPDFQKKKTRTQAFVRRYSRMLQGKIKFITLEVRVSNTKAIHLYEKFGFNSLGLRKKYYQDNNEDAIIMWSNNIFDKKYKDLYTQLEKETYAN